MDWNRRMIVLITPMVLAHPLHPSKSRSRNTRRNMRVGWCVFPWRPWFWPIYYIWQIHISNQKALSKRHTCQKLAWPCWCVGWHDTVIISCLVSNVPFKRKIQYSLYHNMDICTMWHCALVSYTSSQSIGLVWVCALLWCWVSLGVPSYSNPLWFSSWYLWLILGFIAQIAPLSFETATP